MDYEDRLIPPPADDSDDRAAVTALKKLKEEKPGPGDEDHLFYHTVFGIPIAKFLSIYWNTLAYIYLVLNVVGIMHQINNGNVILFCAIYAIGNGILLYIFNKY